MAVSAFLLLRAHMGAPVVYRLKGSKASPQDGADVRLLSRAILSIRLSMHSLPGHVGKPTHYRGSLARAAESSYRALLKLEILRSQILGQRRKSG